MLRLGTHEYVAIVFLWCIRICDMCVCASINMHSFCTISSFSTTSQGLEGWEDNWNRPRGLLDLPKPLQTNRQMAMGLSHVLWWESHCPTHSISLIEKIAFLILWWPRIGSTFPYIPLFARCTHIPWYPWYSPNLRFFYSPNMGVSKNDGTPIVGWFIKFISWKIQKKTMITGGSTMT